MVKRRPSEHTAIITVESGGKIVGGEWLEGELSEITICGRFDQCNSSRHIEKQNADGNTLRVYGEYYTKAKSPKDGKPIRISIDTIGVDKDIIVWEDYQSHSVIYV